ncbi:uncharacterized protein LOC133917556 isoform X2 [Phragmites australis]|uniref:uncharacterized protein LOC133917556 isoform X2 n=1 Tax=Phragmites australis TaxID=29695 RepID=UPI002D77C329|nr:uncharacterized protein LOC133917556 isoform X2 [Phragmites australis]
MASPGSDVHAGAAATVCCMCGDHGLPRELFRCDLCRLRLQHRYCSDLYPRAAAYRSCNWCLREERGGGDDSLVKAPAAVSKRRMNSSRDGDYVKERPGGGCSRSAFSAEPGKPVKKPKGNKRVVQRLVATKGRKAQTDTGKPRFRAKVRVRRYKLLAEVISCYS